jgi:hypothetical protein
MESSFVSSTSSIASFECSLDSSVRPSGKGQHVDSEKHAAVENCCENRSNRRKPVPLLFYVPQISHEFLRDRTETSDSIVRKPRN